MAERGRSVTRPARSGQAPSTRSVAAWRAWLGRVPVPAKRIAVVVVLFAGAWAFDAAFAVRHGFFDLRVYYGALNYWADSGGEIYDYLLPHSRYGFTYPPFAALTMAPMAVMAWTAAIVVSLTLTVIASVSVLYWLTAPFARRHGWSPVFVLGIAAALAVAFEPLRETLLFGQVNAVLLALVAADVLLLVRNNRSLAGVGIGIATAIKLTPGVFILYLILTKRYRAAAVASGTTLAATVFAGAVAPDASREFWTDALWNTSRVGSKAFVSNQSLSGVINRWDPSRPSNALWLALVLLVLAVWAWRSRQAIARGDEVTGFALTGLVGVLISPITWVHHLVWVMPALILFVDRGLDAPTVRRRRWLLGFAAVSYAVMCSRLVWAFNGKFDHFAGWVGSNAYVWLSLIMLVALPLARVPSAAVVPRSSRPVEDDTDLDRELTATLGTKGTDRSLVAAE